MSEPHAVLQGLATASPGEPVPQAELLRVLADRWVGPDKGLRAMLTVFETSGVATRHLALPLDAYRERGTFEERNRQFIACARRLGVAAAGEALRRAGLAAQDVTHVVMVTSTGIATPSLDAHLINDLPLPSHVRRFPLWGLGCGGGGAGLGLAADLARSGPEAVVLLVVLELCSLAFVPRDRSKLNLVASALFGDGCAAAVVTRSGKGLELATHRTTTWPSTLDMMGWDLSEGGLSLVLSRSLPAFVRERMGPILDDLRSAAGWASGELPSFAAIHPGGPKVLDALEEVFAGAPGLLEPARGVLARHGNMSAPTFLYVLEQILADDPRPEGVGMYSVLGPGFTCDCGALVPARELARR